MDPAVHATLRLGLGALLAIAAFHKLSDPPGFRRTLLAYDILPSGTVAVVAPALGWIELAIGFGLVLRPESPLPGWAAALLFASYLVAILVNVLRGRTHVDCGCFTAPSRAPLGFDLVVRNGVLIACALAATASPGDRPLTWLDGLTVGGALVCAALVIASHEVVRALPASSTAAASRI